MIDSQRLVSRDAAALVESSGPDRAAMWRTRETTYAHLGHETRDLGGRLGNGGPAAGHGCDSCEPQSNDSRQPT